MSRRKVGNMGRGDFDRLCNASGLIYNSSSEDDSGGWDAIVEFPLLGGIALLNSLNEQPIQCLVQIKSSDGEKKGVQVKLSNMKRFCDTPLPCFFFLRVIIRMLISNQLTLSTLIVISCFRF